jgi:hypothetical protein
VLQDDGAALAERTVCIGGRKQNTQQSRLAGGIARLAEGGSPAKSPMQAERGQQAAEENGERGRFRNLLGEHGDTPERTHRVDRSRWPSKLSKTFTKEIKNREWQQPKSL